MSVFDKLESLKEKYDMLEKALQNPDISAQELTKLSKERAGLTDIVEAYLKYKKIKSDLAQAKEILETETDEELRSLAKVDVDQQEKDLEAIEQELKILALPKDPNDERSVILEIRAGTGGDESCLFSQDLYRMYTRYAEMMGWKVELISATEGAVGGFKEVVVGISGDKVYSRLKYESGTHRVQRVPVTETQGRIHTSASTVAILPEADDVEVNLDPKDIEITVCRASGAGGQHVNKTDSAVRMVHIPTGIVVECQDERSQHKNRARAMSVLKARIYEKMQKEQHDARSQERKAQVGSGDRSERIRTYNFPQGRVTDHRINLTLYKLESFMDGNIDEMISALITYFQAELIKQELEDKK